MLRDLTLLYKNIDLRQFRSELFNRVYIREFDEDLEKFFLKCFFANNKLIPVRDMRNSSTPLSESKSLSLKNCFITGFIQKN